MSEVRRRTKCEVNKNNMRVPNAWRSEIDDVRSEAAFCTMKSEPGTKQEVEATLGRIIKLYTRI